MFWVKNKLKFNVLGHFVCFILKISMSLFRSHSTLRVAPMSAKVVNFIPNIIHAKLADRLIVLGLVGILQAISGGLFI
jgi:hypothetical protein